MKIVYVLTSASWNEYTTMVYISASAVRRLHSHAHIVLVTDTDGARLVSQPDHPLRDTLNEIVTVPDVLGEDNRTRSRYLKTTLRTQVPGEFLFLDVDTLPIRPFDSAFAISGDMAAAHDEETLNPKTHLPTRIEPIYRKLGWKLGVSAYYNTGVVLFRDTQKCHDFCREWHKRWLLTLDCGVYYDQPAFNSLIDESGMKMSQLDPAYNAIVAARPRLARGAKILHFCVTTENFGQMILGHLLKNLYGSHGVIDWKAVDRCVSDNHPWGPPYLPEYLWLSGNYRQALLATLSHPRSAATPGVRLALRTAKRVAKVIVPGRLQKLLKAKLRHST